MYYTRRTRTEVDNIYNMIIPKYPGRRRTIIGDRMVSILTTNNDNNIPAPIILYTYCNIIIVYIILFISLYYTVQPLLLCLAGPKCNNMQSCYRLYSIHVIAAFKL